MARRDSTVAPNRVPGNPGVLDQGATKTKPGFHGGTILQKEGAARLHVYSKWNLKKAGL